MGSVCSCAVCSTGRRRYQLEKRVRSPRCEDDVGLVIHEAEPRVLRVCRKFRSACHSALVILNMLRFRLTALACQGWAGRSWSKKRSSSNSSCSSSSWRIAVTVAIRSEASHLSLPLWKKPREPGRCRAQREMQNRCSREAEIMLPRHQVALACVWRGDS